MALTAAVYAPIGHAGLVYEDENWATRPVSWQIPSAAIATWTLQHTSPGTAHLEDVGLHLVNGGLVYALGTALVSPPAGLAAATIFLVHPIQTEAVSYLKARSDLLVTLCLLLAALLARSPRRAAPVGLLALALVAPLCDQVGLLLVPFALLTMALFRPVRLGANPVDRWLGMALVGLLTAAAPILVIEARLSASAGGTGLLWPDYLARQAAALGNLLWLLVDPRTVSIDHDVMRFSPLAVQASVVVLTVGLVVLACRVRPITTWTLAWVALAVAPHFVFRTNEWLSEHQLYPSMVAISIGMGAGAVAVGASLDRAWLWVRTVARAAVHPHVTRSA